MRMIRALVIAPLLIGAKDETPVDPGPAPTFEQGVALGEAAIKSELIDPSSAQFEWPYGFTGGSLKALFGKRHAGWYTCGHVNARNRMGGYTGRVWFTVLINNGAVVATELGSPEGFDPVGATCADALKRSLLRAAPAAGPAMVDPASGAVEAAAKGGMGISFTPTPFGALIMAVAPDSPAARAGLKAGETIESVNGIALKGFDQQGMIKVVSGATTPVVALGIIGVGEVKVDRAPR